MRTPYRARSGRERVATFGARRSDFGCWLWYSALRRRLPGHGFPESLGGVRLPSHGKPNRKILVHAAGGYYPGQDHRKLQDEMRSYIDRGYTVVKKKIGGASLDEDLRRVDSVLEVLQDGQKLCVDANGRFDLDSAIAYAKALSRYDLFWYEEPGDPLDCELQATLRTYYKNPVATGEDLFPTPRWTLGADGTRAVDRGSRRVRR